MPTRTKPARYGVTAQIFHWVIAALIVTQFVLAKHAGAPAARRAQTGPPGAAQERRNDHPDARDPAARLAPRPPRRRRCPSGMRPYERWAAQATHAAFYVLLFAMPLTGWMMSSAKNYSVSWFGLFTWPNLIGKNEQAFEVLRSTHDIMSNVLFAIAVLHILAALKHHFWDRDDVLRADDPLHPAALNRGLHIREDRDATKRPCRRHSLPPLLGSVRRTPRRRRRASRRMPPPSRLEFTGVQAGAEFKGIFHKFSAAVDFSPDALGTARFDVRSTWVRRIRGTRIAMGPCAARTFSTWRISRPPTT